MTERAVKAYREYSHVKQERWNCRDKVGEKGIVGSSRIQKEKQTWKDIQS